MSKPIRQFGYATLETPHYLFEAFDVTPDAARRAVFRAVRKHCKQLNIPAAGFIRDYCDSIQTRHITLGRTYRDYSEMP
jgi:hypothetical protein